MNRREFLQTSSYSALAAVTAAKFVSPAFATGNDGFDIHAHLKTYLNDIGMDPEDSGGAINFVGADPILYSHIRLGSCMAVPGMGAAVGAAAIWKDRTGEGQDLTIDLREAIWNLNPFYKFFLAGDVARGIVAQDDPLVKQAQFIPTTNGQMMQAPFFVGNPISFQIFRTKDDRPVTATGLYHHHMDNFLNLIGSPPDTTSVADIVKKWNAEDLEQACFDNDAIFSIHRSVEEWSQHPQGKYLATEPLIGIEKIGDSDPIPFKPGGNQPLSGAKAISMTHVIAGTTAARTLAEYGAEVMHIARPQSAEHEFFVTDVNVGMRSTWQNIRSEAGQQAVDGLLTDADVLIQNMRSLDRYGFGPEQVAEKRPGIIYLSFNCYGFGGPWGEYGAFDMEACSVSGLTAIEGSAQNPRYPPTAIINDFLAGYIGATGIMAALRRRATEGGSYHVKVSLTRAAMWYASLGLFPNTNFDLSGEEHQLINPRTISGQTAYGKIYRLAPMVQLSATPSRWQDPIVHVRGAALPKWQDG
jgi:crotonobetainyl-CoA:carnitine CoA-transferase CaiB-like acyl-CoA transferase